MPAPHHSVFYRPDALPATQPTASKLWMQNHSVKSPLIDFLEIDTVWSAFSALTLLVRRQEGHLACKKTEWWGAGVVGYLSGVRCRLAHAQLMPLPLTVSCSSKIQIGFTYLVPADPSSPGQRAIKRVYDGVLAWLSVWIEVQTCIWPSWCHCHSLSVASVTSRLVFTFLVPAYLGSPGKGPLNRCVCVTLSVTLCLCRLCG